MTSNIGIFGEVLFDVFPNDERVLGGAPFNVAWHLHAFGYEPKLISRVGDDTDGAAIRAAMTDWGMDTSELQTDARRPTGRVAVELTGGQPSYEILSDRAYDAIGEGDLGDTDYALLYHGTLALRTRPPRAALEKLKRGCEGTVFMDVNLRAPWWTREHVVSLAGDADWIKLNDEELDELAPGRGDTVLAAREFRRAHDLRGLVVTCGEEGAWVLDEQETVTRHRPSESSAVVDTVGAGDAFAAVMIIAILEGWRADRALQRAQEFASIVVRQRGAIVRDRTVYENTKSGWKP